MHVDIRVSRGVLRLAATVTMTVAVAATAHAQQKTDVIFSAGPTGGSWTPMAAAASQVVNKKYPELNVQVEPGAALVNMEKIRNDKADLGWSMTTVMSDAQRGQGQFVHRVMAFVIPCRRVETQGAGRANDADKFFLHVRCLSLSVAEPVRLQNRISSAQKSMCNPPHP